MKKILLLTALICLPLLAVAQTAEKQHYIYNIVTFVGSIRNEGVKVKLDNGRDVSILKDEDGKKIKFNTPAAALMYFTSEGWELYINGTTSDVSVSNGKGSSWTTHYWIIRKPCTKECFDKAMEECIRK
jgi:hypothetical protein